MSTIIIGPVQIVFSDDKTEKIILHTNDFLKNKSRIPMHYWENNKTETIQSFILELRQKNKALFKDYTDLKDLACLTMNTLVISELVKSAAPIKVAEFGSTKGDISYNLMEVLGKFTPESTVCFISNAVGNESGNHCLDCIAQTSLWAEFSMLHCEYTKTNLADNCFDITLVNGDSCKEDIYEIIKEAERVTRPNGLLICWTSGDCLMDSSFALVFPEREEYAITPVDKVITARKTAITWLNGTEYTSYEGLMKCISSLRSTMGSDSIEEYRPYVKQLDSYIDVAIQKNDIMEKLTLIELKDILVDYMNHLGTSYRAFYEEKLNQLLKLY